MAVNSALANSGTVQAIGVNGYWRGYFGSPSSYLYSGLYYPCEGAVFGVVPQFASGVEDPGMISTSFTGSAAQSSELDALESTVSTLQGTVSTQQATLSTLTNAQAEVFDVNTALAAFSFFFGSIVLLWSVAKGGGAVLSAIRGRR